MESIEKINTAEQVTMNEAFQHIQIVRSMIHSMGNNDVEFSLLDGIEQELKAQKISPGIAMLRADMIRENKLMR